jgi:hypothetical protein
MQFVEGLLLTEVCNLLAVLTFVAFRRTQPDEATMKEVEKVLRDNNMESNHLTDWNSKGCQDLCVEKALRDNNMELNQLTDRNSKGCQGLCV